MKTLYAASLLGVAMTLGAATATQAPVAYEAGLEQWRAGRIERLRDPNGWLSLVGLHWLEPGWQSIGAATNNDIELAVGPERLGKIGIFDGEVKFQPTAGAGVIVANAEKRMDGERTDYVLAPDSAKQQSVVRIGDANFVVIERSGRMGLRVKDPQSPTRTSFTSIEHYPVDAAWRFDAEFVPHAAGKTIDIASVINTIEPMPNPGAVVFKKDGKEFRLEAVDEGDGQLFLIFADRTNGKETYGPGRFLYADKPVANRTVVDFNRTYNPPCAFNPYSTCPLPPPENRLDLAVTAGEKKYVGVGVP